MLDSTAMENEQLSTEDRLDVVSGHIELDEEDHNIDDNTSQELRVVDSQKPGVTLPQHMRQDVPTDADSQDLAECLPSTPQKATGWSGGNSPVSSPTDMTNSSELPILQSLNKIGN